LTFDETVKIKYLMKIYIVIPTFNEADNLGKLVENVFLLYPHINIIIVDDNSQDGTGEIAEKISQKHSSVDVIHRPFKSGLGTAYVAGFRKALTDGAELIFEMDGDLSHDPKYIDDFVEAIQNADLVIGSRYINGVRVEGWRFRRLLLSKLANIYVSHIMVKPVWDFTAGYRCYRREVLQAIDLNSINSDGYAFQIEMTHLAFKHGFRVVEIPITFKERKMGYSKLSKGVVMEAVWLTLKCRAPIKDIIKLFFKTYRKYFFMDE